ncbi:MAG: hypothetical protein JWN78_2720 [Bacteroidota bacterium]|nr:hypothetical protein [Bacteroidota bacterium]
MKTKAILIFILLFCMLHAFSESKINWDKFNFLTGNWTGSGKDAKGDVNGTFSFKLDLNKNILVRKSHSVYQSKGTKASHDDLLIIFKDNTDNFKANFFDNEGNIINYNISFTDSSVVFLSEASDKAPQFRLTYTKIAPEKLKINFEFAKAGKPNEFTEYVSGYAVKIK